MVNEPTFSLNPKNGGMNWGYCRPIPKTGAVINYNVLIQTSKLENSETTSTIKGVLYGDSGKSDEFVLGEKFERDSTVKKVITGKDIGKLHKLALKLEGRQPYRCRKITFKVGPKTYSFECLKALEPCDARDGNECRMETEVEGLYPYEITMKAKAARGSGVHSPILIALIGEKGETQFKMFAERGLNDGEVKRRKIFSNKVGKLLGFRLSLPEQGSFAPASIKIKNLISKETAIWDILEKIKNPGKDTIKVLKSQGKNDEGGNLHNPDGGLLSTRDRNQIIKLTCEQKLENPSRTNLLFGPDYPTSFPNYMNVLARCPGHCHLSKEKVYGLGIHPSSTPICIAAIVDNAVSIYGGIISISILPGMPKYTVPKEFAKFAKGFSVASYSAKVKKSFAVTKVDSVDIVEKDFRILDENGKLSNEGRLEVRTNGEWGTICAFGNNKSSAKRICKDIGYKDGEWKTPNDAKAVNYCKFFNGKSHCGAKSQPIHFSHISCTDLDSNFNSCNKLLADRKKCTHDFDAIIKCFNQNFSIPKEIPQNVVRLERGKKDLTSYTGRLEMMRGRNYLPVCNLGFTKAAARVACKQMGWEKGTIITNAKLAKPYQVPKHDRRGFSAEKLSCSGDEKNIEQCKYNIYRINCKHDQDVVIKCTGGNGDPTGKSQFIKTIYNPPPELGKLKIAKYEVNCKTKGNKEVFRGDPGSIFIIVCPSHCGRVQGSVWGTGIYTSNSQICRAAIHSGVIIGDKKEAFIMQRTHGQKFYMGSKNNNIDSTKLSGMWPVSLTFSKLNSSYKNMHKAMKRSFFEVKNQVSLYNPRKSILSTSFIQSYSSNLLLPVPLFEWIQKDFTYNFNQKNNLLITKHKLGILSNSFSFLTKFKMMDFIGKDSYIFSYSGCNGFNILIDKNDRLVIGDICNPSRRFVTGFMVPLNDKILLYFSYHFGKAYLRVYSYSTKKLYVKKAVFAFDFPKNKKIGIGRMGSSKKNIFNGKIEFIQFYSSKIAPELLNAIVNNIKIAPKPGAPKDLKTIDNRTCVSPCTTNPVPPKKGCGPTPLESLPYKPSSPSPGRNKRGHGKKRGSGGRSGGSSVASSGGSSGARSGGRSGSSITKAPGANGTFNKEKANNIVSLSVDCQTNLSDRRFQGSTGKIFRIHCKNCITEKAVVFGTSIYHPLSSICKAASHSGATDKKGGDVIVEILPGAKAYNGSPGWDKSTSATFGAADRSFRVSKAPQLTGFNCQTTASEGDISKAPVGKKFVVLCPAKCSNQKGNIWGTDVYTDNSSICRAAIHYGILSDKGGEVSFLIDGAMSSYKKTKKFGIESLSNGSHVRSFKFLGSKAAINFKWKEDYLPKFAQKWKIKTNRNADFFLSNEWKYVINPNFIHEGTTQKLQAIVHTGRVVLLGGEGEYGSWISLKNADFANGKINFNFMLVDERPFATLLRYNDKANYLALEFSVNSIGNIKLIERVEGTSKVIATKSSKILSNKWYRVQVVLNFDKIKISLQSHKIRKHRTIIKKKIPNLPRGTLGFATQGNNKFYISGVVISEYNKHNKEKFKNNHYSWNGILKSISKGQRRLFCQRVFNSLREEIERCTEIHNFCQIKCDSWFPRKENILNFSCSRDCAKKANSLESQVDKLGELLKKQKWVPKPKDKCDFKPEGQKFYKMGIIHKVVQRGKKKVVTVKYQTDDFKQAKASVIFPAKNLKKCGLALTARKDCQMKN